MIRTTPERTKVLPGAISMTNAQYHDDTSRISKSGLDLIHQSPLHYWNKYLNPNREPQRDTPALLAGRAVHLAILEPYLFREEFAVEPILNHRTSQGKADYQTWLSCIGDKTVIDLTTYDNVMRIRDAVYAHPAAAELLQTGAAEQTWFWKDQETGVACKCRTDFLTPDRFVVDVKTTEDASSEAFGRSSAKYRYHVQAAYYTDGLVDNGYVPEGFIFIAVEKAPPYAVAVYYAQNHIIEAGRLIYRKDLATYKECLISQTWPGYGNELRPLEMPAYALKP